MTILRKLSSFLPSPFPNHSQHYSPDDIIGTSWDPLSGIDVRDNESRVSSDTTGFKLGEHWTIAGATGSGKTVFARELMEQFRRKYPHARRYILNSTADTQFDDIIGGKIHDSNTEPPRLDPAYCSIWTPDYDDMDMYNRWLESLLELREPCIILLDDIASLVGYGRVVGVLSGHMKIMKQGRKHGITVVNGTQEMTRIPTVMFRQMTHFVQLRLSSDPIELSYARRYLNITKEEQTQPHSDYGLFYKRTGVRFPMQEYESYSQFFNQKR